MPLLVAKGAKMSCSQGSSRSGLLIPKRAYAADNMVLANIEDHEPMTNVPPFGMCKSIANPSVASATAAAQGTLTPQGCKPELPSPWEKGTPWILQHVHGQEIPVLTDDSRCLCIWAGVITIVDANTTIEVDEREEPAGSRKKKPRGGEREGHKEGEAGSSKSDG